MLNLPQLSRTDLNLLTLFQAVLEEGHVGRAAARLGLTPSAVSHGLRRLRRLLNDPLFLRTPKGVVPTERALALAPAILEALTRAAALLAAAAPFDPATSARRFVIGAPDAILAAFVAPALPRIAAAAPHVDFGLVQLLASGRGAAGDPPWSQALRSLEQRAIDIAVLPLGAAPARFALRHLFDEDFAVAMREGHPFARAPTLAAFCAAPHLLVSTRGDAHGFVDALLAESGRSRRIAVTAPGFLVALAQLAATDLLAVLPRRLLRRYAPAFGVTVAELPLRRPPDPVSVVTPRAALADAGIAWLVETLARLAREERALPRRAARRKGA